MNEEIIKKLLQGTDDDLKLAIKYARKVDSGNAWSYLVKLLPYNTEEELLDTVDIRKRIMNILLGESWKKPK